MKIICHLAFLCIFQFLFACNQASESSQASKLSDSTQIQTDSTQMQRSDKEDLSNIVFKSTDGGQTWKTINEGLPEPVINDNGAGSNDFMADNKGLWLTAGNGIYYSKPNSTTPYWTKEIFPESHPLNLGEHNNISPGKSGIYAYNYNNGGIFQKKNETGVWSQVFSNFKEKGVLSVFETAAGTIFICTDKGLFKSINSGKSWKHVGVMVGKLVESNGVLMATNDRGILRSTDNGENWGVVISEGGVGIDVERIEGGFAAITYSTVSKTQRIRTTYDAGKTWQAIDAGFQAPGFIEPTAPKVNATLPAKGISDSTRHAKDTTVVPEPVYITTIIQVGKSFFCGRSDGIYKSSDKGKTWKCMRCVEAGKMFKLFVSGNVIYAIRTESHC